MICCLGETHQNKKIGYKRMMKNIPSKCLPREMRSDISIQSKNNIFLIMKIYEPNNSTSKFKGKKKSVRIEGEMYNLQSGILTELTHK